MYISVLIIGAFMLLLGAGLQMWGDEWDSVIIVFFSVISYVIALFCIIFFVLANSMKNDTKNQDIVKDLDTQIYYIRGYVTDTSTKDNSYYETLIKEVEKYNSIYNTYKTDTDTFDITPKEGFENYQLMVYNYETNTITWEDGTKFLKGEDNND